MSGHKPITILDHLISKQVADRISNTVQYVTVKPLAGGNSTKQRHTGLKHDSLDNELTLQGCLLTHWSTTHLWMSATGFGVSEAVFDRSDILKPNKPTF